MSAASEQASGLEKTNIGRQVFTDAAKLRFAPFPEELLSLTMSEK